MKKTSPIFNCGTTYTKGGERMSLNDILLVDVLETPKDKLPWTQIFNNGYRVTKDNIDWNYWNGCVVLDLDTKHYYEEVKPFDPNKLLDALHEYLTYNENTHYYCMQQSNSGKGYHIWLYFNVDKNEVNFKKCTQYCRDIIKIAFTDLGLADIINYKGVLDKCTSSAYQGIYLTNKEFKINELTDTFFGRWDEIDEYKLNESYIIKTSDINEDNTPTFKIIEYKENKKSFKIEHRDRMKIYMTLVAGFGDKESVDVEWCKICRQIISQHSLRFLYNEPDKNKWYDKYNTYNYLVDADCLSKFGYVFERQFKPQIIDFYEPDANYELAEGCFLNDIKIEFKDDKINHIFAGCGFGKTTWAKELGKQHKVCFISPLTSINKSAFTNENIEIDDWLIIDSKYKATAKHLYDGFVSEAFKHNWNICTTWESFVLYEMYNIDFDYIIVDEIHTLYMYDYRLMSINNIKKYLPKAKGIKIVMTGTPSYEIYDLDCYKIRVTKEQPTVKSEIVFYNKSYKGYIYNDIKEWTKDSDHLALVFDNDVNYKEQEKMLYEGIRCDVFNKHFDDSVNYIINNENVRQQVTLFSVYGQAGINLYIDSDKKIRIYILDKNALGIIQYANRVRNKEVIDKIIIPFKKTDIDNSIEQVSNVSTIEEAMRKINILNESVRSDAYDVFGSQKDKSIIKHRFGLNIDCLDLNSSNGTWSLNEPLYKIWDIIDKVSKYETQIQVIYNRLIQNYFTVSFKYLDKDPNTNKASKLRGSYFAGMMADFDFDMIKFDKAKTKLWIEPTKKFSEVITGDLLNELNKIMNRLYVNSGYDFDKLKVEWKELMCDIIKVNASIKKTDISNINLMQEIIENWDRYYDTSIVRLLSYNIGSDAQIAAAYTRLLFKNGTKANWNDVYALADETYDKIHRLRRIVKMYEKTFDNLVYGDDLDYKYDTLTNKIYTYLYNEHTRGKKGSKKQGGENGGKKGKQVTIEGRTFARKKDAYAVYGRKFVDKYLKEHQK